MYFSLSETDLCCWCYPRNVGRYRTTADRYHTKVVKLESTRSGLLRTSKITRIDSIFAKLCWSKKITIFLTDFAGFRDDVRSDDDVCISARESLNASIVCDGFRERWSWRDRFRFNNNNNYPYEYIAISIIWQIIIEFSSSSPSVFWNHH